MTPTKPNKIFFFSGGLAACADAAKRIGIPTREFRYLDPKHSHKLFGLDRDTAVLFWCDKPHLLVLNTEFMNTLRIYEIRVVYCY